MRALYIPLPSGFVFFAYRKPTTNTARTVGGPDDNTEET